MSKRKITSVLVTHDIAEQCYLSEALDWIAFQRIPISSYSENNVDCRVDTENIEGIEPNLFYDSFITREECEAAGLPINPYIEMCESEEYYSRPDYYDKLISMGVDDDVIKKIIDEKGRAIEYYKKQDNWDLLYNYFIEPYEAKLYLKLREGNIEAKGKLLPSSTVQEFIDDELDVFNTNWSDIPSDFWKFTNIDWKNCHADGNGCAYALIIINTDSLFSEFSFKPDNQAISVKKIGDSYILLDEDGLTVSPPQTTRGRPPLPWDEFHVQMARRIQAGKLPDKQEAAIADMQEWCRQHWKREVSRGALFSKIKPYYDALVRKSEKA